MVITELAFVHKFQASDATVAILAASAKTGDRRIQGDLTGAEAQQKAGSALHTRPVEQQARYRDIDRIYVQLYLMALW